MANTISAPWICEYLIGIAEEYGANTSTVPYHLKFRKAQLIKFLTHQKTDEDSWVWATISDKKHMIPVRFSKESVELYKRNPTISTASFTDLKSALIQIKHFRPMFTRIPGREGMSSKSRLALEVKDFDVKGSIGEDRWETPVDVEFDKRIYDWTEGLRSDGGGGNVLKSRKQEREMGGQDLKVAGSERHSDSEQRRHTTRAPIRRTEVHPAAAKAPDQSVQKEDGSRSWKTTWRPVTRRPYNFLLPMKLIEGFGDVPFAGDSDIEDAEVKPTQGADVPDSRTSQPSQTPAKSRRFPNALDFSTQGTAEAPHTPSNWSESGYGDEDVSLASPERAEESDRIGTPMDSPMQVDANVTLDDPDAKEPSTQDVEILSFPPPPSLPLPEPPVTVLVPNSSLPQPNISPSCLPRGQKSFARKTVMQSARGRSIHPDTSAGRILVPNSDTSASYSQPSQSQSQSQSLQAALDQSRPEQRFAQSLSYSPKSQSQFELPAQQGDSQESQKSGPASHLRNEVLPSLNLPARTVDASAEEVPNEALPSNSSHAPQSPKVSEQTIKPEHIASSRLELASPRTWGSPMRMAGSQAANQATEDREEQPLSPVHENGTQTVNGGVESFSTHSEEADDEAEPDPFPSDDTVSFDDQGAEPSDDGEQLSSDDDRMDLALHEHILAPRRASLSRVPSWRPAERSASPDLVPDSQPAPPAPAVPDRPSSQQESNLRDSSEAPALPSSPDVFLDEASFHGDVLSRSGSPSRRRPGFQIRRSSAVVDKEDAVPDVVLDEAQAQDRVVPGTSNHDVEMWIEPTFARRRKRPLVPSTSAEEQPRKKRKIPSSAAVVHSDNTPAIAAPVAGPSTRRERLSTTSSPPGPLAREDSIMSTTTKIKQINLRRTGSTSSTTSRTRGSSLRREGSLQKAKTPSAVTIVRESSLDGRPRELNFNGRGTSRLQGTRSRDLTREPSGSQFSRSSSSHDGDALQRPPQGELYSISGETIAVRAGFLAEPLELTHRSEEAQSARRSGLDSLRSALHMTQENGLPPCNWGSVAQILTTVGRIRHKERTQGADVAE